MMNYVKSLSMLQKTVSPNSELCHSLIYIAQHIHCLEEVCVEMVFMYKHDRPEMVNLDRKQMCCCCWFEKWTANVFDVVDSLPHVALSRKNNEHWEDIGLFVKICIFHVNWVETAEDNVEYNPTLSAYRMCLHGPAVKAVRTVCVIDDTETGHCFLSA